MSAQAYDDVPELEQYLRSADFPESAPDPDAPEEERGRFKVDGDRTAEWALRKIAQAEAELARVKGIADEEVARINEWRKAASAGPNRDVAYFEGLLREYHEGLLEEELATLRAEGKTADEAWTRAKRKTYTPGPAGKLTARRGGKGVNVDDEEEFEEWCWRHPELGRVYARLTADKKALTERARWGDPTNPTPAADSRIFPVDADGVVAPDDGEAIPGVTWYENPADFHAKATPLPTRDRP